MRKIFILILISFLGFSSSVAQVKFGIKGGLDIINFSLEGNIQDNLSASNTKGGFIGPMIDIKSPLLPFGLDLSVLYNQEELKLNDVTEKTQYIVVPLNAKLVFGLGDVMGVFLSTGPQLSFNIGKEDLFEQLTDWENTKTKFELAKSQFSWNVGGGFRLLDHLQVEYTYCIGIGNTGEFDYVDTRQKAIEGELKNKSHQISVAYLF